MIGIKCLRFASTQPRGRSTSSLDSVRATTAIAVTLLGASLMLLPSVVAIAADAEYSPWWGTDCYFVHPEASSNGVIQSNGYVSFRKFPVTPTTIDDASRAISPFDRGITFKMDGGRFTVSWRADNATPPLREGRGRIKMRVTPLGAYNSAIALTVIVDDHVVGDGVFGNMELTCWRPLEDLIEKYLPGSIEGSPPRPYFPLHDQNGNVIPEPTMQR
jgi:hypothetical protein